MSAPHDTRYSGENALTRFGSGGSVGVASTARSSALRTITSLSMTGGGSSGAGEKTLSSFARLHARDARAYIFCRGPAMGNLKTTATTATPARRRPG